MKTEKRAYAVVRQNQIGRLFMDWMGVGENSALAKFKSGDQVEIRPRVAPGEDRFREALIGAFRQAEKPIDHACGRCVPGGELVAEGFICWWHLGEYLASEALPPAALAAAPEGTWSDDGRAAPEGQEAPRCCSSAHVPPDTACKGFAPGRNGRCVYCDHEKKCHPGSGATCEIGSGEAAPEVPSALPAIEFAKRPPSGTPPATHRCSECRTGWSFVPDGAGVHRQRLEAGRHDCLGAETVEPVNPRPALLEEVVCEWRGGHGPAPHPRSVNCIDPRPAYPLAARHLKGCAYLTSSPLGGDEAALCNCGKEAHDFERGQAAQTVEQKQLGEDGATRRCTECETTWRVGTEGWCIVHNGLPVGYCECRSHWVPIDEPVSAAPVDPLLAIDAVTDKEPRPCGRCDEPVLVPVGYRSIPLCGRPECEADEAALHRRTAVDVCPACNGSGGTETICAACKGDGYCAAEPSSAPRVEPEKPYPSITLAEWEVTLWPDNQVGLRWTLGDFSRLLSRPSAMQLGDALRKLAATGAAEPEKLGEGDK